MSRGSTTLKRSNAKNTLKNSTSKRQSRNENEKRRRNLFSQLITNLEDALSVEKKCSSNDQYNKLDKASILHQALLYLQKHHQSLTNETKLALSTSISTINRSEDIIDFSWKPPENILNVQEWLQIAIQSMNCFFLVIKPSSYNGEIAYVSTNISSYIGYSPSEIINHSLYEFISPSDHDRLRDYLLKDHQILEKCVVSWKQSSSNNYEQCTIIGAFRNINENEKYFMSVVKVNTLDRTSIETTDDSNEKSVTHLNISGRFIFIDSKTEQFFGYNYYELIDRTFFNFVHPDDLTIISRAHRLWKENGCGISDPYRFLTKGQQWIYIQTSAQVQLNSWTGKPEYYICTTNPIQCTNNSSQKQLRSASIQSTHSQDEYNSPPTSTTVSNCQENVGTSSNEISSFLSHLGNEKYRVNIVKQLNERRKYKQNEIRVRVEEIQVIDDMITYVNQYRKILPNNAINHLTSEPTNNMFESLPNVNSTNDVMSLNCSFPNLIDDPTFVRNNLLKDEIVIDSLFSPFSPPFNLSSPITPSTMEDIYHLTTNINPSTNRSLSQHQLFP